MRDGYLHAYNPISFYYMWKWKLMKKAFIWYKICSYVYKNAKWWTLTHRDELPGVLLTYTYTCTHTHTHTQTCTYTHTHTYTLEMQWYILWVYWYITFSVSWYSDILYDISIHFKLCWYCITDLMYYDMAIYRYIVASLVHTHTWTHTHTYTHRRTRSHACTYACGLTCIHMHAHTHCTHVGMESHIYTHTYMRVHTCTHTNIYTHTHTHMHVCKHKHTRRHTTTQWDLVARSTFIVTNLFS